MKIIIQPRQSGKTMSLIREAARSGGTIVCGSKNEADLIALTAKKMELRIRLPITYYDFIKRDYHTRGVSGFLIDNADNLLRYIAEAVPIEVITMTDE